MKHFLSSQQNQSIDSCFTHILTHITGMRRGIMMPYGQSHENYMLIPYYYMIPYS